MDSEEHVQLIVKGVDQGATKLNKDVSDGLKGIEKQAGATAAGVNKIVSSLTSLRGQIKLGFDINLGKDLHNLIGDITSSLPRAFFGAVDAGQAWLMTIKEIERATGLNATQASEWAAVMQRVGVPLGDVQRILSQLGHNLLENEDLFKRAGIATRDQNGQFLDTYTILTNIRQAMSANGQSIQNAGLAQELLARGGYKWLEVLQLTDAQWKAIANDAARSGQVVTDQQTRQAEEMSRLQDRVQGAIQGLQTAIFSGVEPVLSQFVDSFASWIEQHMQEIANFVANVASFIAGVLGGLLGIDFAAKNSATAVEDLGKHVADTGMSFADWKKNATAAKAADDALTTSLNEQIKSIDRQIAAIQHRSDAQHAAEERARLDASLASAQAQLADLKGNAPYTAGLSNAEAVLARQKHAQDIVDAEKAVSDAKQGINQFEADQSVRATIERLNAKKAALRDEIAAHKKAVDAKAAYDTYLTGLNKQQDLTITQAATSMYGTINEQAKEWRDNGIRFAGDIKTAVGGLMDALLGQTINTQHGSWRTGGLIGALSGLGDVIVTLGGIVVSVAGHIADAARWLDSIGALIPNFGAGGGVGGYGNAAGNVAGPPGASGPPNAAGGVFDTLAPTRIGNGIMGEAGGESVVILSHPRGADGPGAAGSGAGAAGGPTTIINAHFDMLVAPNRDQVRSVVRMLFDEIDARMAIKAGNAPVGIQAFRGSTI